jgi:4-hydroxybenzoate polyprenyltransferase
LEKVFGYPPRLLPTCPDKVKIALIREGGQATLGNMNLLKIARPGFWSTTVWFYLLPVGTLNVFDQWTFWLGLAYVTFPLGLLLYGWNDRMDVETDRLNPRKGTFLFGAKEDASELARLPWRIVIIQAVFAAALFAVLGWKVLAWFAAVVAVNHLYNGRVTNFKGRPVFDMLNQAGYVLVFVLSSWLNGVPQLPWTTFVFGALFAMHSHLLGQVMDIVPDLAAGRRTTAAVIGIVPSKIVIAVLLAAEAMLVQAAAHDVWLAGFLGASACWFVVDAFVLGQRPYAPWQMRFYLLAWNVMAMASMPWVWKHGTLAARLPI